MDNKLFIHRRYLDSLDNSWPIYFDCNGVLKKGFLSLFNRVKAKNEDYWYCLDDLPSSIRSQFSDLAISYEEYVEAFSNKNEKGYILDDDQTKIYVTEETPVLPIVGNLLPSDGTRAFTVVYKDGAFALKPIIICWNFHWSELFTGRTTYGSNVFCLASDLSKDQIANFIDDIIFLRDVPDYLRSLGEEDKIKRL